MKPRLRTIRIAAILAVVVIVALAWALGIFHQLADTSRLARTLVRLGVWGYVAYVVAYALLQPFGLPGTAFVLAASLIWPWPTAFALSLIGTMAASVVGFSFARLVARDWVSKIIPPRFRRYDDALARRAFVTVFLLRLVFWMPPLLHAFFGISRVRFWTHFWASLAGYLLPLFLMSLFGQRLFDYVRHAPPAAWLVAGACVIAAVGALVVIRRRLTVTAATKT